MREAEGKACAGKRGKKQRRQGKRGGGYLVPARGFLELQVMVVMWDVAVLALGPKALDDVPAHALPVVSLLLAVPPPLHLRHLV